MATKRKKSSVVEIGLNRLRAYVEGDVIQVVYEKRKTDIGIIVEIPYYLIQVGKPKPIKVYNPLPDKISIEQGAHVTLICSIKKRKVARGTSTTYTLDDLIFPKSE